MRAFRPLPGNAGHHAVQFYRDSWRHCRTVADFLSDGLAASQPTIVIATPEHRTRIMEELTRRRFSHDRLSPPRLVVCDAAETLAGLLVDGIPDRTRLARLVARFRADAHMLDGLPLRVYSEMVNLLSQQGEVALAMALDRHWSSVSRSMPLSLLHGYQLEGLSRQDRDELAALHTDVLEPA